MRTLIDKLVFSKEKNIIGEILPRARKGPRKHRYAGRSAATDSGELALIISSPGDDLRSRASQVAKVRSGPDIDGAILNRPDKSGWYRGIAPGGRRRAVPPGSAGQG